ncbi:MAG: hypothetical protein ACLPX5_15320, partial [Dissulfurispiraceae bacterium]
IVYSYNVFKCIENQVSQSTLHAYAAGCLTPSRPVAYQGECTAISSDDRHPAMWQNVFFAWQEMSLGHNGTSLFCYIIKIYSSEYTFEERISGTQEASWHGKHF